MTLVAVVVLAAGTALALFPRQTVSLLTHVTGSPSHSEAIPPFAHGQEPELRLAAVGDVGYSGRRAEATGRAVATLGRSRGYDALLLLGDNVYPAGDPARLDETVFGPLGPALDTGARLIAILGNHDVMQRHGDAQAEALGMPARWYAVHLGDVLIVALDSNQSANGAQQRWLRQTLAASTERWKIALLHHPPYSAGYQGSNLPARKAFEPLFEQFAVQLVLSGHDHDYQRSYPIEGVTYVVTGAAAETRRTGREEFTAFSGSWHSFADISVFPDHLLVRGVNQDVRMFDEAVIPFGR
jgi:3',5'-cyclic AMP phosphodiesterase CpdA